MFDYGWPQTSGTEVLNLTQVSHDIAKKGGVGKEAKVIAEVTGAISWRPQGIMHKKNEVFIDVIENVTMLVSAKGNLLHAGVDGQIVMKVALSGMPECRFGLNDRLTMD